MPKPSPPTLRVLISGAGIAGPALAFWLKRLPAPLKCDITLVERHPQLRNSGQQIDLRGQGVDAMRKMGIEAAVRAVVVNEPGLRMLDRRGRTVAYFGSNKTGRGAQTFSAEWEVMRGDLCDVLYDATKDLEGVRYVFGCSVESFEQDEAKGVVRVRFSDGREEECDLLVGADGVGSRIRRRMFTDGRPDKLDPISVSIAFYTVPPQEGDVPDATFSQLPGRRCIMTRRDRPDCLRVFFSYRGDDEELSKALKHGTVAEQKEAWAKLLRPDAHNVWQLSRYIEGLNSPQADDFYAQELAMVKVDNWSHGRVVLLGDAGYCPSPMTGFGTSLALAGAYVLAGEIARVCGSNAQQGNNPWDNLPSALAAYEKEFRPLVQHVQATPVKCMAKVFCPDSAWVIKLYHWIFWLITVLRIDQLAARFSSDDRGPWKLPHYTELAAPEGSS